MKIKHIFRCAFAISIGAFAQNSDSKWDYNDTDTESKKAELTFINTNRIEDLLDKKKRMNTNTIKAFRIQIYSGNRNGSTEAKNRFNKLYPEVLVETSYEQPYFKTKVNAFRSHLDAEKTLKDYKKHFKNAFIFEETIAIDKL